MVVAAITSNLIERDLSISVDVQDVEEEMLPKPSVVRCDKIYTLSQSLVVRKYGTLRLPKMRECQKQLTCLFRLEVWSAR